MRGWTLRKEKRKLYRLARQRHQAGKDVHQVRMVKDEDGKVMPDKDSVLTIWKKCCQGLINEEHDGGVKPDVHIISKDAVGETWRG